MPKRAAYWDGSWGSADWNPTGLRTRGASTSAVSLGWAESKKEMVWVYREWWAAERLPG